MISKLALVAIVVLGCSGSGSPGDQVPGGPGINPRPPGERPGPERPRLETIVDSGYLWKPVELVKKCLESTQGSALGINPSASVDGHLSDWGSAGSFWPDNAGDNRGDNDLTGFHLGATYQDLFVYLPTDHLTLAENEFVYLELFQGHKDSNDIVFNQSFQIRVREDSIELWRDGSWQSIPRGFAADVSRSEEGLEFRLSRVNFLGTVLDSPLWGLTLSVGDVDQWHDFGSFVVFPGLTANGYDQFRFSGCLPNSFSSFTLNYQQVENGGAMAATDVVRYAEDLLELYFETKDYPVLSMPLFVVAGDFRFSGPVRGAGPAFMGGTGLFPGLRVYGSGRFGIETEGQRTFEKEALPEIRGFRAVLTKHVDLYLYANAPNYSEGLRKALTTGMVSRIVNRELGAYFWLDFVADSVSKAERAGILLERLITEAEEGKTPGGVVLKDAWLASGRGVQFADTSSNAEHVDAPFWFLLGQLYPNLEENFVKLRAAIDLPGASGYIDGAFADEDFDGLPGFIENADNYQARGDNQDSDADGWSDFAEYVLGKDPANSASFPEELYADGSFGDFLDLIPGKIFTDDGGDCDGRGDIKSHAVIIDDEKLIIGIRHGGDAASIHDKFRWKVNFDAAKSNKSIEIVFVSGAREFEIVGSGGDVNTIYRTPFRNGAEAIEAVIKLEHLGLSNQDQDLRYMVTSFDNTEGGPLCDDTPWTEPLWRSR